MQRPQIAPGDGGIPWQPFSLIGAATSIGAGTGFEDVRAQDVLPCLLREFRFELFIGYGGVIDVFIDRGFGPNFDPACAADRAFIDKVHGIGEAALLAGRVTPTQAVMVARPRDYQGETATWMGLSPETAVRDPGLRVT